MATFTFRSPEASCLTFSFEAAAALGTALHANCPNTHFGDPCPAASVDLWVS